MKKCSKCGKDILDSSKYCSECGAGISQKLVDSKESESQNISKRKNGNRSGIIIVLLTIFFSIIVIVISGIIIKSILGEGNPFRKKISEVYGYSYGGEDRYGKILLTSSSYYMYLDQKDLGKGKILEKDLDNDKKTDAIKMIIDANQVKINIKNGNSMKYIDVFDDKKKTDKLPKEYGIQVTAIDLDYDGIDEVLVAIGNGIDDIKMTIYKYDNKKIINIGNIKGEEGIFIEYGGNIIVQNKDFKNEKIYRYENLKIKKIRTKGEII